MPDLEKLTEELRVKVPPSWKTFLEGRQTTSKNVSDLVREALEGKYPEISRLNEPSGKYPATRKKRSNQ